MVKSSIENSANETDEVARSPALVYDHLASDLNDKMNDLQHEYFNLIVSVLHVHISHDDCMEVIVLRGEIKNIRLVAESLLSLRGVRHGKLFVTLPARRISGKRMSSGNNVHRH